MIGETEGGFRDAARKQTAALVKDFLKELVRNEADAIKFGGEECFKFGASALMHDEKRVDVASAETAEIVVGKNRFSAETCGGVFRDDEDAQRAHDRPAPKSR